MLRIRNVQADTLRQAAEDARDTEPGAGPGALELQVHELLRERFPALARQLPVPTAAWRVRMAIHRAARYGISDTVGASTFLALMLGWSARFDEHPAVQRLLTAEDFEPEALEETLREGLVPEELLQLFADDALWMELA